MSNQLKADLSLLLMVFGWGLSYYMLDSILLEATPLALNAVRFLGAFSIALIFGFKRLKNVSKTTLKYSLLVGMALFSCYIGVTYGIQYTTISNSAFLCALPVIFVPIFQIVFLRKKPETRVLLAVVICLIGIMLLTLKEDFSINLQNLKGDLLSILCAVSYAVDLLLTEKAVKEPDVNPFHLGVFQLGVTGALMLLGTLIMEESRLPATSINWGYLIFLTVVCTGLPFILQPIAQQYTTAAHVGIIFTLEPVFAAIVAYFLAGEVLTTKAYIGAIIMVAALLLAELDPRALVGGRVKSEDES